MNHKLAQLSLSTSNKAGSTGDIFVAQPDSTKESLAGKLFIIVEINSTKIEGLKIINFLIDNINHNYYQNEKIILRERISTLTVEHIFEAALAKINKNFSEYTRNEKEYQISEIGKQNENDKNQSASQKLFSNVISGKIPPNGFFLFTNEALPEYIGSNQLIKIITTLPPQGAAEQIKQTLLKINSYVSFSAIIIQSMLGKKTESPVLPKTESAQKSINTLNRTEEQTENLLTPSGVINIGKWLKFPLQLFNRVPKNQNVIIKDKIFSKKRTFTKTKKVINAIKNFFIYTFGFLIFLTKNITNKEKLSGIIKNFNQNGGRIKLWIINLIYGIVGLNKKSKIFLILSLIFLILFIFNLSRIKIGQNKQEEKEKYNQLTSLIEQKQNQAEANLLYNNEGGAKKLFDEIDRLINEFPNETEEQQKKTQ